MRLNLMDNIDYSTRDYAGYRDMMIKELKKKVPEYSDFTDSDLGIVLIELLAMGQDIQSYYIDRLANEVHLATSINKQNVIELCANLGYTVKGTKPAILEQVFEIEPQEVEFAIPKGFQVATNQTDYEKSVIFETMETLIIPPGCTGLETDLEGNYLYKVKVEQGYTIQEELLGTSNGTPNQQFYLYEKPVIEDSIEVKVFNGNTFELWEKVDTFIYSNNVSKHYMVKLDGEDRTKIVFGDDLTGMIPSHYVNGVVAKYKVGGGEQGNVSIGSISYMPSQPYNILSTKNITGALVLGEESESILEAKLNALKKLRTMDRAVTLQDFIDVAYLLDFVKLADVEEVNDGRTVKIYLVSKYGETLTELEKQEALEFYQKVKMIGVIPQILDVSYVPLNFRVEVTKQNYDNTDYDTLVKNIIKEYYKVDNVYFKQSYSQSKLLKELMDLLPNVEDISITLTNAPITLEKGQLMSVGEIEVEIVEV